MDALEDNYSSKIDLGLNPANYNIEEEVEREIL